MDISTYRITSEGLESAPLDEVISAWHSGEGSHLHQRQLEFSNNKTNRRLGLLSVLSAIFLPLTLLTGIVGMNFIHMPGLSFVWAYPALLILTVIIGAGPWQYFKRSGWI